MEKRYRAAVEALLFGCADPVSARHLAEVLEADPAVIEQTLAALQAEYDSQHRGICLLRLEDRWQMAARSEFTPYIQAALAVKRNAPLSPAALEVLAIIAYNQPVSRAFIEQVRGVDSSSTVQTLMQKGLVEEAGRLDLPGRPIGFGTTDAFLRTFGLSSLEDLPPLHDESSPLPPLPEGPDAPDTPEDELPPEDAI